MNLKVIPLSHSHPYYYQVDGLIGEKFRTYEEAESAIHKIISDVEEVIHGQ